MGWGETIAAKKGIEVATGQRSAVISRNHNVAPQDQDPSVWPSVTAAAIKSNLFRYRHLPYLFSLHFYASLYGGTIQRPVFFEFPNDSQTYELSYQFLWGPALMVMPVVYERQNSLCDVYGQQGLVKENRNQSLGF
uniref:Glycosyl hydrolase family 31 C-terminal domain-containing protein n=1 Tax=Acrobeloides nanus TaxID=290746 RepID=A0A914CIX5_9BILA